MINEKFFEFLLWQLIREGDSGEDGFVGEGERQFAPVPRTIFPELSPQNTNSEVGIMPHPLLSRTQQFSGIDPSLTPIPGESQYQHLYLALRYQKTLKNSLNQLPTLKR